MDPDQLRSLFEQVRAGAVDVEAAMVRMRHLPFEDLGFARIDHHRALRHGMPEVIFALGKTAEHVISIAGALLARSENVLITRTTPAMADRVLSALPGGEHFPMSGAIRY